MLIPVFLTTNMSLAQLTDSQLGSSNTGVYNYNSNFYDLSDPQSLNIKVSVWGWIKSPGRYIVPSYVSVIDLLSFAGGPTDGSDLEDLRLYRILNDGSQQLIKFDYNDLMWEDKLSSKPRITPDLQAGDILVVPGAPRLYFRDWYSIGVSTISVLISLATLLLVINQ
jgi:polysaccharide export outer membrane protein